jgi:hypothetical protein
VAAWQYQAAMGRFQQLWVANVTHGALMSILGHDMKSESLLSDANHHGRGFTIWLLFESEWSTRRFGFGIEGSTVIAKTNRSL